MKHSSSEVIMRRIMVVLLVLCALTSLHVGVVEVMGERCLLSVYALVETATGLMKRSWVRIPSDRNKIGECVDRIVVRFLRRANGKGVHGKYTFPQTPRFLRTCPAST